MNRPPKICFAFLGNPLNDSRITNLSNSLKNDGCEIYSIGFDWSNNPKLLETDYQKIFKLIKGKFSLLFYSRFAIKLLRTLIKTKCEVYFAEDFYTLPFVYFVARIKRAKVIYNSREIYAFLGGHQNRPILSKVVGFIERFDPTIRRNVRKTIKDFNLQVEVNDRYDEFYPILIENKSRHDVKPTHSYEDLLKLKELLPDAIKLFMVYHEGNPIGGSLMFYVNPTCALCFYNMLKYDYAEYKPIQRVMYEVVKDATERGYSYVDIGVSQDTKAENPMTPSMHLIEFKEKFDAKTIMRNTLYKKL